MASSEKDWIHNINFNNPSVCSMPGRLWQWSRASTYTTTSARNTYGQLHNYGNGNVKFLVPLDGRNPDGSIAAPQPKAPQERKRQGESGLLQSLINTLFVSNNDILAKA